MKANKQQGRLSELKLKMAEESLGDKDKIPGLQESALGGDNQALLELSRIDPNSAKIVQGVIASNDEKKQAEVANKLNILGGRLIAYKNQFPDAADQQANLPNLIQELDSQGLTGMADTLEKFGVDGSLAQSQLGLAALKEQAKGALVEIHNGDKNLPFDEQVRRAKAEKRAEEDAKNESRRHSDFFDGLAEEADAARDLEQSLRVQASIPLETGPGTGITDTGRRGLLVIASLFGKDEQLTDTISKVNNVATFKSIQESLVANKLKAEPGVKTDGDAERARTTLANINNPQEANRFITNMLLSEALRKQERDEFAISRSEAGEKNINSIRKEWREYVRQTPLLGKSPTTGKPIFIHEFIEANPGEDKNELLEAWRETYAN
jgi:hypothetical protein